MPSELLNGPPLRLADVAVLGPGRTPKRLSAQLLSDGGRTVALVYAERDGQDGVVANALLLMGAARLFRALRGLLQASVDPELEEADERRGTAAMRRLQRAEGEARAALAAASSGDGEDKG